MVIAQQHLNLKFGCEGFEISGNHTEKARSKANSASSGLNSCRMLIFSLQATAFYG